jgi:hypothetical protein
MCFLRRRHWIVIGADGRTRLGSVRCAEYSDAEKKAFRQFRTSYLLLISPEDYHLERWAEVLLQDDSPWHCLHCRRALRRLYCWSRWLRSHPRAWRLWLPLRSWLLQRLQRGHQRAGHRLAPILARR